MSTQNFQWDAAPDRGANRKPRHQTKTNRLKGLGDTPQTNPSHFLFKLKGRFVGNVLAFNWIDADPNGTPHGVFLGTLDTDRRNTVDAQWLGFDAHNAIHGGKIK